MNDYSLAPSVEGVFTLQKNSSCTAIVVIDDDLIEDDEYITVDFSGSDMSRIYVGDGIQAVIRDDDGRKLEPS